MFLLNFNVIIWSLGVSRVNGYNVHTFEKCVCFQIWKKNKGWAIYLFRLMTRAVPLLTQWSGVTAPDFSSTQTTKEARPAPPERTGYK